MLNKLAEAVRIPKRFKNKSIDSIIKKAKREYFSSHRMNHVDKFASFDKKVLKVSR